MNYCLRCGSALELYQRFGRLRPTCPNCHWIYFADPKVAAAALILQDDQVLLVRRAVDPLRGQWSLPAGFVDADEDPTQTVRRECLEETGLSVQVTNLVDVFYGQEHPRGAHIILVYRVVILGGDLHPADDVDGAAFFSLDNLPDLAFSATRKILGQL